MSEHPVEHKTKGRKRILIVDDEEGILEELVGFFVDEGYDVISAEDGEKAIELIRSKRPGLCILDLKLPDMSGLLVLKLAKEEDPDMKVIVNTG